MRIFCFISPKRWQPSSGANQYFSPKKKSPIFFPPLLRDNIETCSFFGEKGRIVFPGRNGGDDGSFEDGIRRCGSILRKREVKPEFGIAKTRIDFRHDH
ncbi:hypothetical protein CDAR_280511 [Caerostris darwini]|uniref:Ribosomal protein S3 n=1 Tax=Caerostris darwini TaxID=1538125 RepID=A0AAV4MF32_9ARAC|nr:hypothetical protein CDAR_280511 [Caerostris darwini]